MSKSVVTTAKMSVNGGEIIFPSPVSPGVYAMQTPLVSGRGTVKEFPLGTRYIKNDGRVYRYCYFNGDADPEWGAYKAKLTNTCAVAPTQATAAAQLAAYGENLAAGAVGSNYVTVTIDAEIGILTTGVLSEDELAGGYIVIGNGSGQHPQMRMIVSHPALAAAGSLTLRIDEPIISAVTAATTTIELMESPYYCIKADGSGGDYVSFIGIPSAEFSSGDYGWIQTWGPCWITSNSNTCNSARDRTIVFVGNGSVESSDDETMESGFQIAGYALDMSSDGGSNAPMVMLTLGI